MFKNNLIISTNKNFGYTFAFVFFIISIYFYTNSFILGNLFLFITILLIIITISNEKLLYPLNYAWSLIGMLLGIIISPIIMFTIYLIVVFPTGLALKLFRIDLLKLKRDNKKSYWIKKDDQLKHSMKDQF
jgi:membrane-bound metal-dependent hydrolase YbcI (DUF457 family)